jgi:O-antigen ligase
MNPREKTVKILDYIILLGMVVFLVSSSLSIAVMKLASGILILLPWLIKSILERRWSGAFVTKLEIPILVFLLASLLASLASYRIGGWEYILRGLRWFPDSATVFLVIFVVAYNIRSNQRRPLVYALLAGALFNSLIALGQFIFAIVTHCNLMDIRPSGIMFYMTFGCINMLAATLAVSLAIFDDCSRRWKLILWATAGLLVVGCAVSLVRSALLGLLVSMFVIIFLKGKRIFVIIPILIVVALLLVPQVRQRLEETIQFNENGITLNLANQYDERLYIFKSGWEMVCRYPILGVGLHNVAVGYTHFREKEAAQNTPHLHNNFLQITAQSGFVGLGAFIFMVFAFFWVLGKRFKLTRKSGEGESAGLSLALACSAIAGLAGFLAMGIFEYNFGDYESVNSLMILMGLALTRNLLIKDTERK